MPSANFSSATADDIHSLAGSFEGLHSATTVSDFGWESEVQSSTPDALLNKLLVSGSLNQESLIGDGDHPLLGLPPHAGAEQELPGHDDFVFLGDASGLMDGDLSMDGVDYDDPECQARVERAAAAAIEAEVHHEMQRRLNDAPTREAMSASDESFSSLSSVTSEGRDRLNGGNENADEHEVPTASCASAHRPRAWPAALPRSSPPTLDSSQPSGIARRRCSAPRTLCRPPARSELI